MVVDAGDIGSIENNNININNNNSSSSSSSISNSDYIVSEIDERNFHVSEELYNMVSKVKLIRLKGKINGVDALMLLDSGSSADFINTTFVQKHAMPQLTMIIIVIIIIIIVISLITIIQQ